MATTIPYYKTVARIPSRVSGTLSLLGSGYIAYDVVRHQKLSKANHRFLLGMSVTDFITSFCSVLGRIPAPSDAPRYSGLGTTATCSAQGFFYQSILSTVAYNGLLSFYYLLVVRYDWSERRVRKIEPFLHAFALGIWLSTGFTLLGLGLFNPAYFMCFIESLPKDCDVKPYPCIRGIHPNAFRWGFFYGPVWTMIVAVTVIMCMVYFTVLRQEKRMELYWKKITASRTKQSRECGSGRSLMGSARSLVASFRSPRAAGRGDVGTLSEGSGHDGQATISTASTPISTSSTPISTRRPLRNEQRRKKKSHTVAVQGMWYVAPFYLTWFFPLLAHSLSSQGVWVKHYNVILWLTAIFMPLQGFLNLLVYLRPKLLHRRRRRQRLHDASGATRSTRFSSLRASIETSMRSFRGTGDRSFLVGSTGSGLTSGRGLGDSNTVGERRSNVVIPGNTGIVGVIEEEDLSELRRAAAANLPSEDGGEGGGCGEERAVSLASAKISVIRCEVPSPLEIANKESDSAQLTLSTSSNLMGSLDKGDDGIELDVQTQIDTT